MIWHSSSVDDVLKKLGTSKETGLFNEQLSAGTKKYGKNTLSTIKKQNFFLRFLYQFKNITTIILIIAALLSFVVSVSSGSSGLDFALIIIIAILNGIFGVLEENRVEKALNSLRTMSGAKATVIRNSNEVSIFAKDIIPGDIILLNEGDQIPADGRIIECEDFRCDENAVTGEPVTVDKDARVVLSDLAPMTERANMVYSGSVVTAGRAKVVVVATGSHTEIGKISKIEQTFEIKATPLQNQIKITGKMFSYIMVCVCVFLFVLGMIFVDGGLFEKFTEMFMNAAALATVAIPEGVIALITFVTLFGIKRMVRRSAVVDSPYVMENLGNVSVICTDKTGTLTQNKMTAVKFYDGDEIIPISEETLSKKHKNAIMMAAMCCDGDVSFVNGQEIQIGDHTEAGIVYAATKYAEVDKETLDSMYPRVSVIPFTSDRKIKTTVNMIDGKPVAVVKGSPDILIDKCVNVDAEKVNKAAEEMAAAAMRVIGVAFKPLGDNLVNSTPEEIECDLVFGGLIGLIDPPRDEVSLALERCKNAGVKVVMITGDQLSTAVSSAKNMGIMSGENAVITGDELSQLTDEEFLNRVDEISVYCRVNSEQKIRIIEAFRSKGEVVLMTGDSVNDAPVLKAADIGCAMGDNGTDVAKDAADVTIKDDNFSTIVKCVEMGRNVYNNIQKGTRYLFGCKLSIILSFILTMVIWQTSPLLALPVVFTVFVIDLLPAFALGCGEPTKDIMKSSVNKSDKFFSKNFYYIVGVFGVLCAIMTLVGFGIGNATNTDTAKTMGFAVLAFSHIFASFALSTRLPLWDVRRYKANLWQFVSMVLSIGLMVVILTVPFAMSIFGTVALGNNWLTVIILSIIPSALAEIFKIVYSITGKK